VEHKPTSPFESSNLSPLQLAAVLLVVLGIAETILLVLAYIYKFSFSGGSVFYIYLGYRLFRKNQKTYKTTTRIVSGLLMLISAALIGLVLLASSLALTREISIRLDSELSWPSLVTFGYCAVGLILAFLLFHPRTRAELDLPPAGENPWTLYLTNARLLTVLASGGALTALLIGPHILSNPFQEIVSALRQNRTVNVAVGEIDEIHLLSVTDYSWTIEARIAVIGSENTGYYYASLSPDRHTSFTSYDFLVKPPLAPQASPTPLIPETFESTPSRGNDTVLLSTSFETEGLTQGGDTQPFFQAGSLTWERSPFAHTGSYAINVIPDGNSTDWRLFQASFYGNSPSAALLSARLDGEYSPFDVAGFDRVMLAFWRFSTSNPSETHNCLGSLVVQYRLDDDSDWQSKMVYCGHHRSNATDWQRGHVVFETTGREKLEIRFAYEFPIAEHMDKLAVYLVDDLEVRGYLLAANAPEQ